MPILKWSYYCKLSLLSVIFACIYAMLGILFSSPPPPPLFAPISNFMGHGLTKDKLAKSVYKVPSSPYETSKFVSLAIIKSRWITRSARFLEKDRRRDSCSPLCPPPPLPPSSLCVTRPNRILIGPMLTMFVDILYLTHHLARKLFYKQIIATAGSPPP